MKKDKKIMKLQVRNIPKFENIQQTPQSEPEPYREFEGTIPMGTCDETIKKIIAEANKE